MVGLADDSSEGVSLLDSTGLRADFHNAAELSLSFTDEPLDPQINEKN